MEKYYIKNIITGTGDDYDSVNIIKKSEKSIVSVVRSKKNGKRFILRKFSGKGEVYKKLMNVSCKNLPEIFSVYEGPDMTAVLEEYVSGDTLFSLLKCDVLSEKEAGDIVVQLCNALDSIHGIGAVHRDIKPENIIIDGNRVVLIDFDASRIVDPDKSTDTKILGTTGYAPPEQYGLSQTDSRSDIYALGVVLNVMLTGEHPSTKLAEGGLGKIVQKCTMIAPESRFQSTGELKSAVEDIIKPHKKAKFGRSVLIAAAVAVLGIILSTAFLADKPGVIETGFCGAEENGKNLEWTFYDDGTLRISGTGRMADYNLYDEISEIFPPWKKYKGEVYELLIEDGVETIGNGAFREMNIRSEKLVLPESLSEIGTLAFCMNNFSGELVLPEGLKILGDNAFQSAGKFSYAYIPSTVVEIFDTPFRYCGLDEIIVHDDNSFYKSSGGALFNKEMTEIIQLPENKTGEYILPESVKIIGDGAFEKCGASEIIINGDIETISGTSFQFYSGKIVFGGKVGTVKAGAFHNEQNETEVFFLGGEPEKLEGKPEDEWNPFMGNITIFYSEENGKWDIDENGKWNGYKVTPYAEDDFSDYIEISDLGAAKGKSLVLPPDFYDYWSAEEIITENIKLSMPGNLENYVNYKFSDDILTFTVGNVPKEEWEKALSEVPEGESMVIASIILEAPSENVCKIATHNGNGPTYSNLKKQEQSGAEIKYDDFNALMDYDWTGQEVATIIYENGKKSVAPVEANSVFYKVIYWETYDGKTIRQILPYEIVIGEDCFAYSFEDEDFVKSEPLEYDTEWLDIYWKPVENPERVVFKTVFRERKEAELSVFNESGLSMEIFEKPGFINVSVEDPEKFNPELLANSEILILPPDSRPRKEGESLEEWLESVYSETKYAGCKITAGGIGSSENLKETADFNQRIVDGGYFYDVRNRTICVSNLFPMNSAKTKDGTLWYTINYGRATLLIMDWYLENPEENPGAKPETKEYIYHDCEKIAVIR
ncbi:MAG: leucine-rich repeat protein [Oscillospiraceae bacterium]|nr:leucine-rich repeat protein [Oscillospiraceae bacterium]